jgi:hypothetical protein
MAGSPWLAERRIFEISGAGMLIWLKHPAVTVRGASGTRLD